MANKFPLILNTSANQIQEIASGDNLDLTGCKIVGLDGINSAGIVTFTKAHVGAATTWGEDLVVTGNARVTGILTVGTNSVTINGNDVNITGVTTSANFKTGTSNLHNVGLEIAGINVLGADTPIGTGATIYDAGGAVFTGVVTATNYVGTINTPAQPNITSVGTLSALNVSGNVSIGGTLTYEDVTNVDAVGLITARAGVNISDTTQSTSTTTGALKVAGGAGIVKNLNVGGTSAFTGTATFAGAIDANSDLDVDGHTNLDNVSIAGITTASSNVYIQKSGDAAFSLGSTNAGGATIVLDGDSNGDWSGNDYSSIRHDSSGNLVLTANSPAAAHCYIKLGSAGHYGAMFKEGAESLLRYNNSTKIATTNTGAQFTGTDFGFNATPGGTPASKNVFLAIGDSDTGIVQDGDGQLELWANATEVANINAIDGYTSTKRIYTTGTLNAGTTVINGRVTATDFLIGGNAWYRAANSGYGGLYNATDQTYLYSGDANYFELCFKADQTSGGLRIRDGYEGHNCGSFDANSNNNEIGIKTRSAEWGIKCTMNADTTLYNDGIAVLSTRTGGATFTGTGAIIKSQTTSGTGSNYLQFSDNSGNQAGYIGYGSGGSNDFFIVQHKSSPINLYTNSATRWQWDTSGNYVPYTDNQVNIGSSSKKVAHIHATTGNFDVPLGGSTSLTVNIGSAISSGTWTTAIGTGVLNHNYMYAIKIFWHYNGNGGSPFYALAGTFLCPASSNHANGSGREENLVTSCHVGGNYYLAVRAKMHNSTNSGLEVANYGWTAQAGSYYSVTYKRLM